jgi:hypothetical protein
VCNISKHRKLIPLRWVFKVKEDGTYKARLCAKGFRQKEVREYLDIYASTAKAASFKMFVAIAAQLGWKLHHIDFVSAFLNPKITEEIYIELPEGFRDDTLACVAYCSRHFTAKSKVRESGTRPSTMHSLHSVSRDSRLIIRFLVFGTKGTRSVLVHVDDVLILSPCNSDIAWLKTELFKIFDLTDKGGANRFLGIDIIRHENKNYLSLGAYIDKILEKFGLKNAHAVDTRFTTRKFFAPATIQPPPKKWHSFESV